MTSAITRHNHYVPIWYQKGFICGPGNKLHYLDLDPPKTELPDGRVVVGRELSQRAPKSCFWAEDLYTTRFGNTINDEVERYLFGAIDNDGANAVRAFANNDLRTMHRHFQRFFEFLDAQKLRTPKGLDWIKSKYPRLIQLDLMLEMQHLRQMHCTMWFESVREIVSAQQSDVKFIITDHPVTTYNAACPPTSPSCLYPEDPSIELNGTQTIFALDADHCLVLTNLENAKNPSRTDALSRRQNARYAGQTITRTDAMIRTRNLTRDEVNSINYLLKARSRRYVAAYEKDWLYPAVKDPEPWAAIGRVLLPPTDELWHFGGEIYVGYQDGSTHYQDAFGRTSGGHEYLKKKEAPIEPGPNCLCGCGSGRRYKKCCKGIAEGDRSPWDVYSIRDRNIIFGNAVIDILGLAKGKTWEDVRRELSDDQVKSIHEMLQGLWPKDTNIAELLPRPDRRVFRTLYMGRIDPRTIAASVTSWLAYFDEIVVVNPFPNPNYMNPEYSPIHSPGQHKEQTLKNVSVLLTLMPFIDFGIVHMVPDPMEFNIEFRRAVMSFAEERVADWKPEEEDMQNAVALAKDDYERANLRLPEQALRELVRKSTPGISEDLLDRTIAFMKEKLANDPLALLQPVTPGKSGGQLLVHRAINLELALYFGQLTGSAIYTDDSALWKQLHAHTGAAKNPNTPLIWESMTKVALTIGFPIEVNSQINLEIRAAGRLGYSRRVLRRIWNKVLAQEDADVSQAAEQLASRLRGLEHRLTTEWSSCETTTTPSQQFIGRMNISVPASGFELNSVHRLLITFGRENRIESIPLAIFLN